MKKNGCSQVHPCKPSDVSPIEHSYFLQNSRTHEFVLCRNVLTINDSRSLKRIQVLLKERVPQRTAKEGKSQEKAKVRDVEVSLAALP